MLSNKLLQLRNINNLKLGLLAVRNIHSATVLCKVEDKREMLASLPAKDEGTAGEKSIDIDNLIKKKVTVFPDINTPKTFFNEVHYNEIAICNIKVSPNNTIINLTDHKGVPQFIRSCGIEGFKNSRKGTNIAAQATAVTLSGKIVERGIKYVRVCVRGLGPGRMSAIKGLQMGGLNIVSITDTTAVSWNPQRPRKQKRL